MSKSPPPIPPEQRSAHGGDDALSSDHIERRDSVTGLQSNQPGDADANLEQQGRQGGIHQNVDKGGSADAQDR